MRRELDEGRRSLEVGAERDLRRQMEWSLDDAPAAEGPLHLTRLAQQVLGSLRRHYASELLDPENAVWVASRNPREDCLELLARPPRGKRPSLAAWHAQCLRELGRQDDELRRARRRGRRRHREEDDDDDDGRGRADASYLRQRSLLTRKWGTVIRAHDRFQRHFRLQLACAREQHEAQTARLSRQYEQLRQRAAQRRRRQNETAETARLVVRLVLPAVTIAADPPLARNGGGGRGKTRRFCAAQEKCVVLSDLRYYWSRPISELVQYLVSDAFHLADDWKDGKWRLVIEAGPHMHETLSLRCYDLTRVASVKLMRFNYPAPKIGTDDTVGPG